jgi:hypothetical protein
MWITLSVLYDMELVLSSSIEERTGIRSDCEGAVTSGGSPLPQLPPYLYLYLKD